MDRLEASFLLSKLNYIDSESVSEDVDLAKISQWRIGGKADLFIRPSNKEELIEFIKFFHHQQIEPVVIGLTSNLLFADEGVRAPIIQIGTQISNVEIMGNEVTVDAGIWVPKFARKLMQAGLTGGEHICGIPGTLGGLICMNGGSQRKSISDNLVWVESIDGAGVVRKRSMTDCNFGYRQSVFQKNAEIVIAAKFEFESAEPKLIRKKMLAILSERRKKFPRKVPNCGSVFKSDPAMYAELGPPGEIIEKLGFKGMKVGGAQVSPQHANFIVNLGYAKASDVINIVKIIHDKVYHDFSYEMDVEMIYIDTSGKVIKFSRSSI